MKKDHVEQMAVAALGIAVVFLMTRVLQIPIPFGYAHAGNAAIFFFSVFFGPQIGGIAAGFGSMLADLTSFPVWALPTLVIKSIMGILIGAVAGRNGIRSVRTVAALLAGSAEMVLGYFVAGAFLYGGFAASAAQIPGLVSEAVVGVILFYALAAVYEKTGLRKRGVWY